MNFNKSYRNDTGFTIIEFALVLAIAALIFLVAFLAVPALQRNQRDLSRKDNAAKTTVAIQNNAANSKPISSMINGCNTVDYPDNCWLSGDDIRMLDTRVTEYMSFIYLPKNSFFGNTVNLYFCPGPGTFSNASQICIRPTDIIVFGGAKCNDNKSFSRSGGTNFVVIYALENGQSVICQSN